MSFSILQTVASTDRRGAEIFGSRLGETLASRGHSVTTVALAPGSGEVRLELPVLAHKRKSAVGLKRLRGHFESADVVIGHGSTTLPACAIAGLWSKTPFVYRSIGDPVYWSRGLLQRLRTGMFLRRATAIVVVWAGAATRLERLYGIERDRIHVIPRGVSGDEFRPPDEKKRSAMRREVGLNDNGRVVAYLGALSPEKNVAAAIRAIASIPDVRLLVAGEGPDRSGLDRLASQVAPHRILFVGGTSDPSLVIGAADALVLPSLTEGTPGVLIEAGMCGVPVVATDVGGVGEIVRTDETGVLVPPNDLDALTAGLRSVLDDGDGLGRRARVHCLEHFELEAVTDSWERLLGNLVG